VTLNTGEADVLRLMQKQNAMDKNTVLKSDSGASHVNSKAALTARERRRAANGNIFEMLASS
jgi:hypothetical protein